MTSLPTTSAAAVTKICQSLYHQIGQKSLLTTENDVESLEEVLEDRDITGEEDEGED